MLRKRELGEYHHNLVHKMNLDNSGRLISIFIAIMLISGVQMILYILGDTEFYGWSIIIIKLSIILLGAFLLFPLHRLKNGDSRFVAYSQHIISLSVLSMLLISIINTFYAQQISSDISIYIMVLFAVVAGVRMKPSLMLGHLIISYTIFAVGITAFQPNPVYRFSHITNGTIMNVIALIISSMFYHYSSEEYKDKLDIDKKNQELKRISERDGLTDLYNHRGISNILEKAIEKADMIKEEIFLGILDLDNFKDINDRYGHPYGDEVLKLIANKINDNIRCEDIAGRYGGDEFIIIFKGATEEQVDIITNRLLNEVRNLKFTDCRLSFSCGVAKWNGETKEKLFERADNYMYKVKKSGRNNVLIEIAEK